MPITDAVQAPRFHHQWLPDQIFYGPRAFTLETGQALESMGYTLQPRSAIGEVNAIYRDKYFEGWMGIPDYRYASHAVGY
jgi:gamma-glutamyltranspeptidase/glutathione hydrolase